MKHKNLRITLEALFLLAWMMIAICLTFYFPMRILMLSVSLLLLAAYDFYAGMKSQGLRSVFYFLSGFAFLVECICILREDWNVFFIQISAALLIFICQMVAYWMDDGTAVRESDHKGKGAGKALIGARNLALVCSWSAFLIVKNAVYGTSFPGIIALILFALYLILHFLVWYMDMRNIDGEMSVSWR